MSGREGCAQKGCWMADLVMSLPSTIGTGDLASTGRPRLITASPWQYLAKAAKPREPLAFAANSCHSVASFCRLLTRLRTWHSVRPWVSSTINRLPGDTCRFWLFVLPALEGSPLKIR